MTRSPRRLLLVLVLAVVPALVLGVFIGALAAADAGSARIPAAVVNQDRFVQGKGANGEPTTIAAGRLVVTSLTKPADPKSGAAVGWRLSNAAQAKDLLASGEVYAVVTIPRGFSKSIATASSTDPERARIRIDTDDAHGYLVSALGGALGSTITQTLGARIAASVITGLYDGYRPLKSSLAKAGSGATRLGAGADSLGTGLDRLATGQDGIASGVDRLGTGARALSTGAGQLAGGLGRAASGTAAAAAGADRLADGVTQYTRSVDRVAAVIGSAARKASSFEAVPGDVARVADGAGTAADRLGTLIDDGSLSAKEKAQLRQVQRSLERLADDKESIAAGAKDAASLQRGFAQAAAGAARLQAASAELRTGTRGLATGLDPLATGLGRSAAGAASLSTGADRLADGAAALGAGARGIATGVRGTSRGADTLAKGARDLGTGLQRGANRIPSVTHAQASHIGDVATSPVRASAVRANEVGAIGRAASALVLPAALWIGAIGTVLLLGAVRRRLLPTGVGAGRLIGDGLLRGGVVITAQVALLLAVLEAALPIPWGALLPAAFVALVAGAAFLAVHQLLGLLLGRAGAVVSLVLLGVQLVAAGGLIPVELVSRPFQLISPYLPFTAAVRAMQTVITGASTGIGGSIAVLVVTALLAAGLGAAVLARRRAALGVLAPAGAPALG